MKFISTLVCFLLGSLVLMAQLPQTNIIVFDFDENTLTVSEPNFVTSDNIKGYDNQPYFIGDFLYITSQRGDAPTDIYGYNFDDGVVVQMTDTELSEFSPTLTPDGAFFSAVCIEEDGKTQRLWKYPLNMQGKASLVMEEVTNVGYHAWLNETTVALFVVGEPHTLQIVNTVTQKGNIIASNVGRGLKTMNGELYYIDKRSASDWMIKKMDVTNYDIANITPTLPQSEDFTVLNDGTILMGSGAGLYKFTPKKDTSWVKIADLANLKIEKITRLAASRNKIAIVVN